MFKLEYRSTPVNAAAVRIGRVRTVRPRAYRVLHDSRATRRLLGFRRENGFYFFRSLFVFWPTTQNRYYICVRFVARPIQRRTPNTAVDLTVVRGFSTFICSRKLTPASYTAKARRDDGDGRPRRVFETNSYNTRVAEKSCKNRTTASFRGVQKRGSVVIVVSSRGVQESCTKRRRKRVRTIRNVQNNARRRWRPNSNIEIII